VTDDIEFPVGPPVDATPARRPGDVTLDGRFGRVERLATRHAASLWNALREHDHTWIYIPDGPFANEAAFLVWLDNRISRDDPYCYAIVDPQGRALGISALMEIRPAMRVGITDRGILRPGMKADVTIFNPQTIHDVSTYVDPTHYSVGVEHVFVNGKAVVAAGTITSERPGEPIRGPGYKK